MIANVWPLIITPNYSSDDIPELVQSKEEDYFYTKVGNKTSCDTV